MPSVASPVSSSGPAAAARTKNDDEAKTNEAQATSQADTANGDNQRIENDAAAASEGVGDAAAATDGLAQTTTTTPNRSRMKLYKNSRFKGYLTLTLASAIHYNAGRKCHQTIGGGAVPCSSRQRRYSMAVSLLSLILSTIVTYGHLDLMPFMQRHVWSKLFGTPPGKCELVLIVFLVLWWSVAVGLETTVQGIAGDGKQQYSIYYSVWACCLVSYYWILEKYLMDAGWSSLQSFIASWPYRAPAWICISIFSLFTFIWYMDLWKNHTPAPIIDAGQANQTDTPASQLVFQNVPKSQWEWLITVAIFTFFPACAFCLVELFRNVTADGRSLKPKVENLIEGIVFAALCVAWIPTVIVATTPGGAASLSGNAYFFTWFLVVFLFEGLTWWIHDYRLEIHNELKKKAQEYKQHQREVLEKTAKMHEERLAEMRRNGSGYEDDDESSQVSAGSGQMDFAEIDVDGPDVIPER
ncbi:hypothetical protein MPSEU_000116800 [Mayamaea pseudoterrestris]|nr:hypothetical protein MPSEU_000116800 [Mayamaea pseudoterrestris]